MNDNKKERIKIFGHGVQSERGIQAVYEVELRFLKEMMKKCRLPLAELDPAEAVPVDTDKGLRNILGMEEEYRRVVLDSMRLVEHNIIYRVTDQFRCVYFVLRLPEREQRGVLMLGPYLRERVERQWIMERAERLSIPAHQVQLLERYYQGLPVVEDESMLLACLNTFAERLWGGEQNYQMMDLNQQLRPLPLGKGERSQQREELDWDIRGLEARYAFERELMQAVSLGLSHKAELMLSGFSAAAMEQRIADSIREMRNYAIIINTLLRKAAESGGVHPMHIDKVSTSFALKIEQMTSPAEGVTLMKEMFRSYCRLVRKHSMKGYSLVVQKAIMLIETDLSANLSLSTLASSQNISSGYLSTVFKKETGKTVSEYIREKRVEYAAHLLGTTHLQIQTIALHCGIMDVQYFSKIFKKQTGKTPKEYRESVK